jgi:deoxyadenosine/deoxycytidine kinase
MALYDRLYQILKPRTIAPDLVVYLQTRPEVLLERIRKRGRPEEKPIRAEYVEEVARAYAEFFFAYNEGPLLIVNASDIDFIANADHRAELVSVIKHAPAGTSHWSRG